MIKELLGFFGIGGEGGPSTGHRGLAFLLVIAGAGIVFPGPKEALVAALDKWGGLHLPLNAPWYVGLPLVAAGLGVFIYGEHGIRRERELAAGKPPGLFVAVRHQSFNALMSWLPDNAVPIRLAPRTIRHIECDQSSFLGGGNADPAGAVRQQERMTADLGAILRSDERTAIGYYGIVHVPLQFLAGCSVSTWPEVALFELNRADQHWQELKQGTGPSLDFSVEVVAQPADPGAVVIRIAISYDVPAADAAEVVPGPFEDIRLAIASPRIDAITHYGQVGLICAAFRRILDDVQARVDGSRTIHVFYAGPVSLGFSLGRQVSRTIHHRVIVYNYNVRNVPRYGWAVEINGDAGTVPTVTRPTSLTAI